jgi:polyisoprenoid-binding protein YceI
MAPSDRITAPEVQELLQHAALAGQWLLDPERSTVSLKNSSFWGLVPVTGVFRQVTATGTVSPAGEVTGAFSVATASVDTKNARRDTHLRSADFFDSDHHPDITFTVAGIRSSGPDVTVSGILSVRDRARPLTFSATAVVRGDAEVWLDAAVSINHADYGLTWNFMGMVSPDNTLTIHAVFTKG